ncbi:hypothetical protein T4A_3582, partial [Trichinella pseudospiralis]
LLHKMKTTMNTTDVYCNNKASTIWSLNIIFGIIAFISNVCLLAVVLRERQIKRTQKLVAAYAVGCAISGAGFAAAFIRRITIVCKQNLIMPLECMYKTPHLTLYAVADVIWAWMSAWQKGNRLILALCYRAQKKAINKQWYPKYPIETGGVDIKTHNDHSIFYFYFTKHSHVIKTLCNV